MKGCNSTDIFTRKYQTNRLDVAATRKVRKEERGGWVKTGKRGNLKGHFAQAYLVSLRFLMEY